MGWFFLDPSSVLISLLDRAVLPPGREIEVPLLIPGLPSFLGMTFYFQGATGPGPASAIFTNMLGRTIR
jgi:hypothetical protein